MDPPMKAARVHRFGPPSVIAIDDPPRSEAGPGELLVRVGAAGVGHWDALVREGKVPQPLPLILGSELSGTVEAIGSGVSGFEIGDEAYGATNELFSGACAEYARPSAGRMARKPRALNLVEAAAVPIVSVTAWADAVRVRGRHCQSDRTRSWRRRQCRRVRCAARQAGRPSCRRDGWLGRCELRPAPRR